MKTLFLLLLTGLIFLLPKPSYSQNYQFKALLYTMPDKWHDQALPTAVDEFRKMADFS